MNANPSPRRFACLLGAALAALAAPALAGQHSICYEGPMNGSSPTGVYACHEDAGGSCQIVPLSGGMARIASSVPGSPPGNVAVYQLPTAATFRARLDYYNALGQFSGSRTCDINAIGPYGYGVSGAASPNAELLGYTSDASGLVSTGVWKLTAPSAAEFNRQTLQVPGDFVAVGGGAQGVESPQGALVVESYQSDTLGTGTANWRRWSARTASLVASQPHQTVTYAIGMRIAGLAARDLIAQLRVFAQDSYPAIAAHPDNEVRYNMPLGYIVLSGGVQALADHTNSTTLLGQFATVSAPLGSYRCLGGTECPIPYVVGWGVESKDHVQSHPGTVQTAVLALPDRLTVGSHVYTVQAGLASATSAVAAHPSVDVGGLRGNYALTGIGARVNWRTWLYPGVPAMPEPAGNLLWRLQPRADLGGVTASAKDHLISSPSSITGYALGIKLVP